MNLLQVDSAGANVKRHFVTVTSGVLAVRGGKVIIFRTMPLEKRIFSEVGGITTRGKDDRAVSGLCLAVDFVLNTYNSTRVFQETSNTGFFDDLDALGNALREVLETFELGIGDNLRSIVFISQLKGRSDKGYGYRAANRKRGLAGEMQTHHSGELSTTAVGAGLAVATEASHLGEVKTELVL